MNIPKFLLIVIGLALLVISTSIFAAVYASTHTTYYSDASKTTVVGFSNSTCGSNYSTDGQTTSHFTVVQTPCTSEGGNSCSFSWNYWESHCTFNDTINPLRRFD